MKKYWCALHQDDSSRKCSSESCQDLRKMSDVTRRIQLLKDNGDCLHCCGDHRAADCRKQDRVCGNGKVNRGCSQQHKMHELFCPAAKCFSIQQVYSAGDSESEDGVVLLIVFVKKQRRGSIVLSSGILAVLQTLFENNMRNSVASKGLSSSSVSQH